MSDTTAQLEAHHGFEHEHVGSIQSRLIVTFIGGVIVANAYLADYLLFPDKPAIGAISAFIGAVILATPIVLSALHEVRRGRMHMTVLVAVAVVAAFALGDPEMKMGGYKVAGVIAFFMLLATLIEQQTAAGARESVEKLMTLTPPTAELISGETVEVSELKPGDRLRVRPGDRMPADGRIITGETTINEATITGESLPADKGEGDEVFAGTHNLTGALEVEVIRVGEDTTLGKVKRLILEAEQTRTPFMQLIDRYAAWYTPLILMVAFAVYVFSGGDQARAVAVLVIACPCAFVLATPTAMVAGLSAAARLGILIKNVGHLEAAGDLTAMVFDKTGTLTTGALTVTRMAPAEGVDGVELLEAAASVEQNSRHPVAQAVCRVAERANLPLKNVRDFRETPGKGVVGKVGDSQVVIGRASFLEEAGVDLSAVRSQQKASAGTGGMSMLYVAKDGECIGWVGLEDKTRPEAQACTSELQELGVKRLSLLTGDRWGVAKKVAAELGCTDVQGECLPE
ncbi:MAG: cation-translocating P-type ATPase, partial [Candidatus Brocadiia bacterium]